MSAMGAPASRKQNGGYKPGLRPAAESSLDVMLTGAAPKTPGSRGHKATAKAPGMYVHAS